MDLNTDMDPPPQHCVSSLQVKGKGITLLKGGFFYHFSIKCPHRRQFWKLHRLGLQKRDTVHVCLWVKGHGILRLPPPWVPHQPDVQRDDEGGEGHSVRSTEEVQARQEQISIYMTSAQLHPRGYLFHHLVLLLGGNIPNRHHQETDGQMLVFFNVSRVVYICFQVPPPYNSSK